MKKISRNDLKWIAMLTMVLDHIGCIFLSGRTSPVLYYLLRAIGRISFPLFCFLLVQGMEYTHSRAKYLFRLFLFSLLSEIPFDLAMSGRWMDFSRQNVFFTLFIGAGVVWGLQITQTMPKGTKRLLFCCVTVFAGMLLAYLLHTDYSLWGVLMMAAFFLFSYDEFTLFTVLLFLCLSQGLFEVLAMASLPLIRKYSPQKEGGNTSFPKWFYYWFYPVHLFLLWALT